MSILEQARALTQAEKIKFMEALWSDLSLVEEELASASWHEAGLRETEARIAAGMEHQMDWDEAKRHLCGLP
jgi:hypothetical protein